MYKQQHDTDYLLQLVNVEICKINKKKPYKPNTISIESIKVIKYSDNIYLFWHHPASSFGDIKDKIFMENACNHNKTEEMIEYLPYTIPCHKMPIIVKVAAIFMIEDDDEDDIKTYESVQSMPILITSASLNNDNNDDDDK